MRQPGCVIAWLDEADPSDASQLGGKCASLAELIQSGFGVPAGFAVTTGALWTFMERHGLLARARDARARVDARDVASVAAISAEMTAAFAAAPVPGEVEAQIRDAYDELARRAGVPDVPVAVRSSGVAEDLAGASFAGQYDTYLWICGGDDVVHHVKRCWAGLFAVEVLTYQPAGANYEPDADEPGLAVAVQQMVDARTAGVMLTLDPVTGDRSKIVIEASWGLGEGVVSGEVTPDRFRMDKVTLSLLGEDIAVKTREYRHEPGQGVALREVPAERRERPSLEAADLIALTELGRKVERHRGSPQDIEWAVDDAGRLHVLQVRPETVWSRRDAKPVAAPAPSAVAMVLRGLVGGGA
jgi:pyruvate,water dikinase